MSDLNSYMTNTDETEAYYFDGIAYDNDGDPADMFEGYEEYTGYEVPVYSLQEATSFDNINFYLPLIFFAILTYMACHTIHLAFERLRGI